jgi:hypothetical protein
MGQMLLKISNECPLRITLSMQSYFYSLLLSTRSSESQPAVRMAGCLIYKVVIQILTDGTDSMGLHGWNNLFYNTLVTGRRGST